MAILINESYFKWDIVSPCGECRRYLEQEDCWCLVPHETEAISVFEFHDYKKGEHCITGGETIYQN